MAGMFKHTMNNVSKLEDYCLHHCLPNCNEILVSHSTTTSHLSVKEYCASDESPIRTLADEKLKANGTKFFLDAQKIIQTQQEQQTVVTTYENEDNEKGYRFSINF